MIDRTARILPFPKPATNPHRGPRTNAPGIVVPLRPPAPLRLEDTTDDALVDATREVMTSLLHMNDEARLDSVMYMRNRLRRQLTRG